VVVNLIRFFKFYGNRAVPDISTQTRSGRYALLDKVREVGCKDAHSIRDFPRSRGVTALWLMAIQAESCCQGAEMYALEQLQWRVTRPRDPYG
jgi:hypothetical protein